MRAGIAMALGLAAWAGMGGLACSGPKPEKPADKADKADAPAKTPGVPMPELGKPLTAMPGASLVRIDPSKGDGGWMLGGSTEKFEARNRSLLDILVYLSPNQLAADEGRLLPGGVYDADFPLGGSGPDALAVVKPALEKAFGVRLSLVKRPTEVYVLSAPSGKPAAFKTPTAPFGAFWMDQTLDGYVFHRATMDRFTEQLRVVLRKPVFNETKLSGEFAFDLKGVRPNHGPTHVEAVNAAGLRLKTETRPIDWLVVEKAAP